MGAQQARSGGISLKMVESINRHTVRFRPFSPRLSPLLLGAKWESAAPAPAAGACSAGADYARPVEWWPDLTTSGRVGGSNNAALALSKRAHGNRSGAGRDPKPVQSHGEPTSVAWPGGQYAVRIAVAHLPEHLDDLESARPSARSFAG